ncbi:MAG: hypothetical protein ABJC62_03200 [Frankiaceae bacterium]
MRSLRWTRVRLVAPGAVAALAAAAALGGPAADASTGTAAVNTAVVNTATTDAAMTNTMLGTPRTLTRSLSAAFPTGQRVGANKGFRSPEFPKDAEGAAKDSRVGRSRSARSMTTTPTAAALAPPVVASTAVSTVAPGLAKSFEGLTMFDQRYANNGNQFSVEPPDQALCVGNGYAVEVVNDVLRVYRTSGATASAVTDLNTFYGYQAQINRTTNTHGPVVTDPVCLFDTATQRFFVTVLTIDVKPGTGDFTGGNTLDIAVSKTADPTGGYRIYRLPVQNDGTQGTSPHKDCPCIGDYPHIGADASGFYVTTNEYPFTDDPGVYGNNFNGAQIYGFDKNALAAGSAHVSEVEFNSPALFSADKRIPGFTVWPAQSPGRDYATAHNGTEYLLSSIASAEAQPHNPTGFARQIGVWALSNTASLRTAHPKVRLQRSLIHSGVYGVPPLVSQKVGPVPLRDCTLVDCLQTKIKDPTANEGPLNANDSRMQQTWYSGGKLYGALDTIVRVGGNIQSGVAWYVVDPGASPASATMAKHGYLAVAHNNVSYPAIATVADGSGVMAFTLVGKDYYPSAGYALITGTGPGSINLAAAGAAPQDGFSEYSAYTGKYRPRWGDYGAATVSGGKVWIASEYVGHSCTFAQYKVDPTCGGKRAALGNWSTRISQVTP